MKNLIATLTLTLITSLPTFALDSSFTKGIGSDTIGASLDGFTHSSISEAELNANASAGLSGNVRLFGKKLEAVAAEMLADTASGVEANVRVCGFTVMTAKKDLSVSKEFEKTKEFVSVSKTFFVWIIPVRIEATLGGGIGVGESLSLNVANIGVNVDAYAKAWAYGEASATIDFVIASFGLHCDITLFNSQLTVGIEASVKNGLVGSAKITVKPIEIELYFVIKYWFWGMHTAKKTISEWSAKAVEVVLL